MFWTLTIIFLASAFVLTWLFFAGIRRTQSGPGRYEIPEEYLAIVSDFPPENFIALPEPVYEPQSTNNVLLQNPSSRLFRVVQFLGYQEARVASAFKRASKKMGALRKMTALESSWRRIQKRRPAAKLA